SVGFVIAMVPTSRDLNLIDRVRVMPPQPIGSAFEASYQTVLSLVVQRGLDGVIDLASRSFATYQNLEFISTLRAMNSLHASDLEDLQARFQPRSCADPEVT